MLIVLTVKVRTDVSVMAQALLGHGDKQHGINLYLCVSPDEPRTRIREACAQHKPTKLQAALVARQRVAAAHGSAALEAAEERVRLAKFCDHSFLRTIERECDAQICQGIRAFSGCEKLKKFLARRGSASRPARPSSA